MPAGASRPPRRLALLFLLAALAGCHRDVPAQAGFYFWRTRFPPTARERAAFAALGVRTLRVRVFDVVRDSSGVHPIGKLVVSATAAGIPEVLPVVFLREQVFRPGLGAEDLARRILSESDRICHDGGLRCRGMELDCDWNATSRPGFFRTASILADSLHARGGILHATLRLHQYRALHAKALRRCYQVFGEEVLVNSRQIGRWPFVTVTADLPQMLVGVDHQCPFDMSTVVDFEPRP